MLLDVFAIDNVSQKLSICKWTSRRSLMIDWKAHRFSIEAQTEILVAMSEYHIDHLSSKSAISISPWIHGKTYVKSLIFCMSMYFLLVCGILRSSFTMIFLV